MKNLIEKAGLPPACDITYRTWCGLVVDLAGRAAALEPNPEPLTVTPTNTNTPSPVFSLAGLRLTALPDNLVVNGLLDLRQCQRLRRMGSGLRVNGDLLIGGRLPGAAPWLERWTNDERNPHPLQRLSRDINVPLRVLPADAEIDGDLVLRRAPYLREIPAGFRVNGGMMIVDCPNLTHLPDGLKLHGDLILISCPNLKNLPVNLKVHNLTVIDCGITALPAGLAVKGRVRLQRCRELVDISVLSLAQERWIRTLIIQECPKVVLPKWLSVRGTLILEKLLHKEIHTQFKCRLLQFKNMPRLKAVTTPFHVEERVTFRHCPALRALPGQAVTVNILEMIRCTAITTLPPKFNVRQKIDLTGCTHFTAFQDDMFFEGTLDVSETALTKLPSGMRQCQVLWRGHRIPQHYYFEFVQVNPLTLLGEANAEVRRLVFEKIGSKTFFAGAPHQVLDQDRDPGGVRRLLSFQLSANRNVLFLHCFCPSTGREYLLGLPPTINTCHQGAAWLAGFDNPDDYQPAQET